MIAVVGGGLVGSMLSILLKQKGYAVEVFEKRSDPRVKNLDHGRSINLIVTSRGIHALKQAGLADNVMKLSVPVYGRMIHNLSGEQMYQPYGQNGEYNLAISRGDLNIFLIQVAEKAGVPFHFNHDFKDLNLNERTVRFSQKAETHEDVVTKKFELLFSADGGGSGVRRFLRDMPGSQLGEKVDRLEADYKELLMTAEQVERAGLKRDALHIWPRGAHMLMGLPNRDGSMTLTLYLARESKTGGWDFKRANALGGAQELFASEFAKITEWVPDFAEQFYKNPQGQLATVRCENWVFQDCVALIGDAAHAIVPFFGQGMNCGFEDCTVLMRELESGARQWPKVLAEYARERKPNANAIADMALENFIEMRDRVADPAFQFLKKVEGQLEKRHPRLYKTRYGLITYSLVPYAKAQQAGEIQRKIFAKTLEAKVVADADLNQVPWEKLDVALATDWQPFAREIGLI